MSRHNYFITSLAALVVLLTVLPLRAQEEEYPTGPEAGRKLAAELRQLQPADSSDWKGVLNIHSQKQHKTWVVPVSGGVTSGSNEWRVVYTVEGTKDRPAEKLTVVHSTNGPNQYLYAVAPSAGAALGAERKLTGAQAAIPFAGSDFWLSDLGFEFFQWPEQKRLKGEMRNSRPCYVLDSINPEAKPGGYARIRTWIEKESGGPMIAEAYGSDGKLLKEFSIGSVKKVNGRWEVKDMEMGNLRTESTTKLEFDLEEKRAAK